MIQCQWKYYLFIVWSNRMDLKSMHGYIDEMIPKWLWKYEQPSSIYSNFKWIDEGLRKRWNDRTTWGFVVSQTHNEKRQGCYRLNNFIGGDPGFSVYGDIRPGVTLAKYVQNPHEIKDILSCEVGSYACPGTVCVYPLLLVTAFPSTCQWLIRQCERWSAIKRRDRRGHGQQ